MHKSLAYNCRIDIIGHNGHNVLVGKGKCRDECSAAVAVYR